eukprot:8810663-Alexandrium_andersonii.AAC.1
MAMPVCLHCVCVCVARRGPTRVVPPAVGGAGCGGGAFGLTSPPCPVPPRVSILVKAVQFELRQRSAHATAADLP